MARPQKEGLEYFSHDVYASSDEKIEPLLLLYGAKGYAFYFIHLEYIYRNKDLEFDISDAETREVIQQKLHVSADEYEQILQTTLKKKCFDKNYYDKFNKLTSNGIKKRASSVLEKREKMRVAYEKKNFCNVSAAETTHIKESKVKESKVNINSSSREHTKNIFNFFATNIGLITPHQVDSINSYIDDGVEADLIIEAMKDSLGSQNKWSYTKAILNNCISLNIKTLEQYNAKKVEKQAALEIIVKPKKSKRGYDGEQTKRILDDLEKEGFKFE